MKTELKVIIGLLFVIAGLVVGLFARSVGQSQAWTEDEIRKEADKILANSPDYQAAVKHVEDVAAKGNAELLAGFRAKVAESQAEIKTAEAELKTVTNGERRRELEIAIEYATKRIEVNQRYIDTLK